MARTVTTTVRKRGMFGKLFKWTFIAFNLLMAAWLFSYWYQIGGTISGYQSKAEQVGATVGAGAGTSIIIVFWIGGAAVLGALTAATRGKLISTTETID